MIKISQDKYGRNYCGPTAIAMVLSGFGIRKSPLQVFSMIKQIRKKYKIHLDEKRKGWSYFDEHFLLFKQMGLKCIR